MSIFNKYTSLFIIVIGIAAISIYILLPNFETEEFDLDVIDNIIDGVTTTSLPVDTLTVQDGDSDQEELQETPLVITQQEVGRIEKILENNKFESEITNFEAYLLIGSDERSDKTAQTRGFVSGKEQM